MIVAHQAKRKTAEAKAIHERRGQTIELRFADTEIRRGLRRFGRRGLERVRIEVGLGVLAHHLLVVQAARQRRADEGTMETLARPPLKSGTISEAGGFLAASC